MRDRLNVAYHNHKGSAKERGIPFELSYAQWLEIWTQSGHLAERGRQKGQYVMSRFNDEGPYSPGDVEVKTCNENCAEGKAGHSPLQGRRLSEQHRRNISKGQMGRYFSPETRAKISARMRQ